MKWLIFTFILAGCNRTLPVDAPDIEPVAMIPDAGSSADLLPPVDIAIDLPCIQGSPSECAYAAGTEGCAPGYCRGHKWVPDLWNAGCAEWDC